MMMMMMMMMMMIYEPFVTIFKTHVYIVRNRSERFLTNYLWTWFIYSQEPFRTAPGFSKNMITYSQELFLTNRSWLYIRLYLLLVRSRSWLSAKTYLFSFCFNISSIFSCKVLNISLTLSLSSSYSPPARWGLLDFKIALSAFSSSLSSPPRQLLIAVGTAGPQLPAPASSRSQPGTSRAQWAPLDLNRGPPEPSGYHQIECQIGCQNIC